MAAFVGAFVWIAIVGTNRSMPDLYLGIVGFAALLAALLFSIAAVIIVFRRDPKQWPWLIAHLGGVALASALGFGWMGAHLV